MKWFKTLKKVLIIMTIVFSITYFGIYIIAKFTPKLSIKSANK